MLSIIPTPTLAAEVPGIPQGFHVISGDETVTLSWNEPAENGGSNITGYRIYRGLLEDGMGIVEDVTDMTYTDTGLQNGQTYYYAVSALNAEGEGEKTEVLPATPEDEELYMPTVIVADYTTYVIIYVGEGVYLDIGGESHSLIVDSITGTNVTFTITSDPQSFTMSEGDTENVDVDGDGTDDFKITCVTITSEPDEGYPQTVEFSLKTGSFGPGSGTPGFELWTLLVAGLVAFSGISMFRRRK
ncbi:MAG: fibronectin type III domain-containing protein [Candidatus Thermoplasmatota archaeon]|nr:fibronectin type III domain-containing protein [Candidatus Thermoplasmatota archaeon]MBU1940741.1 fibronectin type III domain-containing protein [Candidatus Thermoplasmatota archaeon]